MDHHQCNCNGNEELLDRTYLSGMLRAANICRHIYINSADKNAALPTFERFIYEVETDLALHMPTDGIAQA